MQQGVRGAKGHVAQRGVRCKGARGAKGHAVQRGHAVLRGARMLCGCVWHKCV